MKSLPSDTLIQIFLLLATPVTFPLRVKEIGIGDRRLQQASESALHTHLNNALPFVVTAVCRDWRKLALSTGSLWSSWDITAYDPNNAGLGIYLRFLERALQWSRSSPLLIAMRFTEFYFINYENVSDKFPNLIRIFDCLVSRQVRWKSLYLSIGPSALGTRSSRPFALKINPVKALKLQTLKLMGVPHTFLIPEGGSSQAPFPLLQSFQASYEMVQKLNVQRDFIHFSDTLRELRISLQDGGLHVVKQSQQAVIMHNLRYLDIRLSPYGSFMVVVFDFITCPALQFMALVSSPQYLRQAAAFLERSNCSLETFEVIFQWRENESTDSNEFRHSMEYFLQRAHTLIDLRIDCAHFTAHNVLSEFSKNIGGLFRWVPKLTHFWIRGPPDVLLSYIAPVAGQCKDSALSNTVYCNELYMKESPLLKYSNEVRDDNVLAVKKSLQTMLTTAAPSVGMGIYFLMGFK